jgi:hypothetical protein
MENLFGGLSAEKSQMYEKLAKLFGNRQYPDHSIVHHLTHEEFKENCFDCILQFKKGKERKKKLKELFENILHSSYEKYHHETVFRLHSLTNHPEQWFNENFF